MGMVVVVVVCCGPRAERNYSLSYYYYYRGVGSKVRLLRVSASSTPLF